MVAPGQELQIYSLGHFGGKTCFFVGYMDSFGKYFLLHAHTYSNTYTDTHTYPNAHTNTSTLSVVDAVLANSDPNTYSDSDADPSAGLPLVGTMVPAYSYTDTHTYPNTYTGLPLVDAVV